MIKVLVAHAYYQFSNVPAHLSCWTRGLNIGRSLHILLHPVCATSEGTGEPALRRLAWAFPSRENAISSTISCWLFFLIWTVGKHLNMNQTDIVEDKRFRSSRVTVFLVSLCKNSGSISLKNTCLFFFSYLYRRGKSPCLHRLKAAYSVTMNNFRNFLFSF